MLDHLILLTQVRNQLHDFKIIREPMMVKPVQPLSILDLKCCGQATNPFVCLQNRDGFPGKRQFKRRRQPGKASPNHDCIR